MHCFRCLAAADFREGVRTNLLEKEKKLEPSWSPPTLKQVNGTLSLTSLSLSLSLSLTSPRQVTAEQLTDYQRPLPAELALQQDKAAAWATVSLLLFTTARPSRLAHCTAGRLALALHKRCTNTALLH
jgi:hypothetical protein